MAVAGACKITENRPVSGGLYLLRLAFSAPCRPGQFVMLRIPGQLDPFLGRPISIFDHEGDTLSLLYQPVGRGTRLFTGLLPGQELEVQGPLGNGFPLCRGDAALIGGGVGIAPLYLLARALRAEEPGRRIRIHLGFREQPALEEEYRAVCDELKLNIGGYVTDGVDFSAPGTTFYACGPTPMLRAAANRAAEAGARLYISLEERMACGVGACLGCTIATAAGNRRVCKDGPVFLSSEVLFNG